MTPAPPGSGVVCINGSAAHLVRRGDIVILATFCHVNEAEINLVQPIKILVDAQNQKIKDI
jgi:aspartate 1-decarboxylase